VVVDVEGRQRYGMRWFGKALAVYAGWWHRNLFFGILRKD
jgi:hypothetical protein